MKRLKMALMLGMGVALGLSTNAAGAGDPETASMIFGMQISEAIGSIPLQLQDVNGVYPNVSVSTGSCATIFTSGGRNWRVDWRADNEFQRGNHNLLLVMSDQGPIGVSGAGLADDSTTYKANFDKAQSAMEYLWGNCSQ